MDASQALAPQDVSQKALQDVLASQDVSQKVLQDVTSKRQKIEILDVAVFTPFLQVFPAELGTHFWFWATSLLSMTCRGLRAMFSAYLPLYKTVRLYELSVVEYKRDWISRYEDDYNWRDMEHHVYGYLLVEVVDYYYFKLPLNY